MRVTQGMMVGNFLKNLNNNYRAMDSIQEQLSTQKKINRPSDDPVGIVTSLRLRTALTQADKFLNNVGDADAWLTITDTALGQASDLLDRARELTVYGANDTQSPESRAALAKEIAQLREQLIQVANTGFDGRFIFGGYMTTKPPFDNAGNYLGDNTGNIQYEIGVNIKIGINITGQKVFKAPVDVFQALTDIENDLNAGNSTDLSNIDLQQLDSAIDNILNLRADVGAKMNRLEMTKSRLEESSLSYNELLTKNDDINVAEVITQLKMQENTYRTALSAGARIIQPSLLDFLR